MQKVKKNVIKGLLLISFLTTIACISQSFKEESSFLEKVVKSSRLTNDTIYYLNKNINNSKNILRKYYEFKFQNKPFYKIYVGYDEEKDSIIYDSKEKQLERKRFWKRQWNTIDSFFTKNDFDNFLKSETEYKEWDTSIINSISKEGSEVRLSSLNGNYVSRPYFDSKKEHAFVAHSAKSNTTLFIFKKEENYWTIIDKVENAGR